MTLRARLTAAFLGVVLVPLLVGGALVATLLPRTAAALQGPALSTGAGLALEALAERCGRAHAAAEAAGQSAAQGSDALRQVLQRLVEVGAADGARVVDARGTELARAGTAPALPPADCSSGEVVLAETGAQLVAQQPLRAPDGAPAGTAVAALAVDDAYAGRLRVAAGTGEVVLLDGDRPLAASGAVPDEVLRAGLREPGEVAVVDGQVVVVLRPAEAQDVGVLLTQPLADAGALRQLFPALLVGAALLATLIGSGLARALARPLEELGDAATRVAEGDLSTTLEVRSRDEVGRLAAAFNLMTERLRSHVQALEDSRDQLRAGVARLGEALAGTHDLDRILAVVLDTAMASTRARSGAVLMREPERDELVLAAGRNLTAGGVPEQLRVPLAAGVTGAVARSGTAVRGRAGQGRDELPAAAGEPTGVPLVAVPLKSSDAVVGVLLLWDREDGEGFDDADLTTLHAFTTQATVAVDNVVLHDEARRLSVTDALTGLTNYRGFQMTVGREIERAARFSRPLALLLLDLDHFKLVNDVWGHQRGDQVLVELAGRVSAQVRDVDTLARYGGEEFVVVLAETDRHGAVHAAERIRAAVRRRPFGEPDEPPLEVTVSIGVAVFPEHGTSSSALLRRADEALYAAKDAGRDGWRLAAAEPQRGTAGRVGPA